MNATAIPLLAAVLALALASTLGGLVSNVAPSAFDLGMLGTYGHAVPIARFFTAIGRFPSYFVLCVLCVIFVAFRRAWALRVALSIVGLVLVWQTSDLLKTLFHRPRPAHPILAETSFSFPSGHADLSIFYYGLWAYFVWRTSLPRANRIAFAVAAAILIVSIGWSRLALGAHFPTDVIGGYFFGAAWLASAVFCRAAAGFIAGWGVGRTSPRRLGAPHGMTQGATFIVGANPSDILEEKWAQR